MRISTRFSAFLATALLGASLIPAVAPAAEAAPLMDVWASGAVSVLDLEAGKEPTFVVTLIVSDEFSEPPKEKVAVPIPNDSTVIWAGEVVSANPADDIAASDLETLDIDGQRYAVFTITKSSRVQVECDVPSSMLSGDGERIEVDLTWPVPSDMATLQMAVIAPQGSRAEEVPEGVEARAIQTGTAYVRNLEDVAAGSQPSLQLVIVPGMPELTDDTTGTAPATDTPVPVAPTSSGIGSSAVPFIIGGLLVAMVVAIAVLVMVRRRETPEE